MTISKINTIDGIIFYSIKELASKDSYGFFFCIPPTLLVYFGVFRSGEYDAAVKKSRKVDFFDVNPICQSVTGWARSRNKNFHNLTSG